MAIEVDLQWTELGWMASGFVSLACLVWLLRSARRSALRDAFALLLATWSLILVWPLWWIDETGRYALVEAVDCAFVVPELLFLATWIASERGRRLPRWLPAAAVVGMVGILAAWVLQPSWRAQWPRDGALELGILFLVTELVEIAALVALGTLFLRGAVRRDSPALALAGFGFLGWPMLLGALAVVELSTGQWRKVWSASSPELALLDVLPLAGAFLYAVGTALYLWWRGEPNRTRTLAVALILGAAAFAFTLTVVSYSLGEPAVVSAGGAGPWHGTLRVAAGLSQILAPLFGTLLIVAESSVTQEAQVWRAVRRASAPALMLATFFVVSEGAQGIFSSSLGPVVGVVATVPLVLLLTPIQRLGERFGHAVAPRAADQGLAEREATYERQLKYAWVDGHIGATERTRLVDLRKALGVTTDRAEQIEESVVRGRAAAV